MPRYKHTIISSLNYSQLTQRTEIEHLLQDDTQETEIRQGAGHQVEFICHQSWGGTSGECDGVNMVYRVYQKNYAS